MWIPIIGENAGRIWQALSTDGAMSATALRKVAQLDEKSLYLALGWLAREGKLKIEQSKGKTLISLTV